MTCKTALSSPLDNSWLQSCPPPAVSKNLIFVPCCVVALVAPHDKFKALHSFKALKPCTDAYSCVATSDCSGSLPWGPSKLVRNCLAAIYGYVHSSKALSNSSSSSPWGPPSQGHQLHASREVILSSYPSLPSCSSQKVSQRTVECLSCQPERA